MVPTAVVARTQDVPDTQMLTNRVLFRGEDLAAQRRAADIRRVEALDKRARQQDVLLQEQASTVSSLKAEISNIREERRIIDLASQFGNSIAKSQWTVARLFLADQISVNLGEPFPSYYETVSADTFVSDLAAAAPITLVPPVSQSVRFDGDHVFLTASGLRWMRSSRAKLRLSQSSGILEYEFQRVVADWKITGISFMPSN